MYKTRDIAILTSSTLEIALGRNRTRISPSLSMVHATFLPGRVVHPIRVPSSTSNRFFWRRAIASRKVKPCPARSKYKHVLKQALSGKTIYIRGFCKASVQSCCVSIISSVHLFDANDGLEGFVPTSLLNKGNGFRFRHCAHENELGTLFILWSRFLRLQRSALT